jgi:hypothetical protein
METDMLRDEVVQLMTEAIDNMNRQMAIQQNAPSDQVEQALSQQRPQLMYVNGMLYDLLVEHGLINTNR